MYMDKALFSSNSTEWGTPQDLFDELNKKYRFTLDPCGTAENAKCKRFFSASEDGLSKSWKGERVFCNPPYGREMGKWIKKCYESALEGAVVVALLPSRTDTAWFWDYIWPEKATVKFIKGRLKFVMNGKNNSAPFPSMIVIWHRG
jgi:site-specific DNA-methyltransferase (adenine-specific)